MSDDLQKISISLDETKDPRIDELVERETAVRRAASPVSREPTPVPFYYNPIVAYAFFGAVASLIVWVGLDPSMKAFEIKAQAGMATREDIPLMAIAMFPLMGGLVGLSIACCDAILSRNLTKAFYCGAVGLGVGMIGGAAGICLGAIPMGIGQQLAGSMMRPGETEPTGVALFIHMVGRAMAWTFAASAMGIGQGLALKSKKLLLNGLVGGLIGGFLGGALFDPIAKVLEASGLGETGSLSRLFGFTVIGTSVGLFTGLVESISKDAWLYMKAGPLAGKQFVIYRDPTVLGSSPKSDIYLFKDAAIEPAHAEIHSLGTRYELRDKGTRSGTYVNGKQITSRVLEPGDTIQLGETVLQYSERQRKGGA